LLQNPEIQFKGKKINPGTSGRWVIQDTKFFKENTEPLKSWAFCVVNKTCDDNTVREFAKVFVQTYISHGGRVENKEPPIVNLGHGDLADTVSIARQKAGTFAKSAPQILFFILPGRDSQTYERLKRNMECRFGMVSQMLAVNQVFKKNAQYCSNVCMKVNAKLGGVTCKIAQPGPTFPRPTMVIGADVSHASAGSIQASTCAITMSMDADATRYAAFVQTNGHRVEMITPANIDGGFMVLFKYWVANHKTGPQHIYYFRDGVSEGQYSHVLAQEIEPMKKAITAIYGDAGASIRWTVTVCSKRHHIRFFPKDGDRASSDKNGNALPGTLVERDVTHPFEYDFCKLQDNSGMLNKANFEQIFPLILQFRELHDLSIIMSSRMRHN
jgi:eukaryotic translation initiation factor 2C